MSDARIGRRRMKEGCDSLRDCNCNYTQVVCKKQEVELRKEDELRKSRSLYKSSDVTWQGRSLVQETFGSYD